MCNVILDLENEKVKEKTMRLNPEQIWTIYRKLKKNMTFNEKIWLLDFRGNMERYEKRLFKLAKKYEISIKEAKEK